LTKGNKAVAICASPDVSPGKGGYIQYRFGTEGHIELSQPADANRKNFSDTTSWQILPLSGGGAATMRFSVGTPDVTTDYVVYTVVFKDDNGAPRSEAGIVVEQSAKQMPATVIGSFKCNGDPHSKFDTDFFQSTDMSQDEVEDELLLFPMPN
jgi:hypothetical protein